MAWRAGYILAVSAGLFAVFADKSYDDPFITYRYAWNLAHGLGFVYNQGERVLSTTTPLFTLILAAFSLVAVDLPRAANLIGCVCLAGGALCIWEVGAIGRRPSVGWAGLLIYPAIPLLINTLGSEMPLYLCLCLAAIACYLRQQFLAAATCAALATITRPDGLLITAALLGHALITNQVALQTNGGWHARLRYLTTRSFLRPALIYSLIVAAWITFAWLYFGSPVPATLAVKQAQGSLLASQRFLPGFLTIWRDYQPFVTNWLVLGLAVVGLASLVREHDGWLLVPAWAVLQVIAYTALGVTRYYWYYTPIIPGVVVAAGLGIDWLIKLLPRFMTHFTLRWQTVIAVVCVAGLSSGELVQNLSPLQQTDPRVTLYRAVGEWLRTNTDVHATMATLEAGVIGYTSQRTLVDFAGIIRPEVAAHLGGSSSYDDAAVWTVSRYQPDYIVVRTGSLPQLEAVLVTRACAVTQLFKGAGFGFAGDMAVYHCQHQAGGG